MLPALAAVVSIMSLQLFRDGTSMTQEITRKREEKKVQKTSRCKKRECCKRRMLCSGTEFEGAALFNTMGAGFPAVFSEVAHCLSLIHI